MPQPLATTLGIVSLALGAAELLAPSRTARLVGLDRRPLILRTCGARELAAGVGLLRTADPAPWLWGRVAGDALDLATVLVLARGRRRAAVAAALVAITALDVAALIADRPREPDQTTIRRTVTIARPPEELRALLQQPGTIARLAGAGAHASPRPDGSSHWVLHGPHRRAAIWNLGPAETDGDLLRWTVRRDDGAPLRTLTVHLAGVAHDTVATLELQLARTPDGRLASPLLAGKLAQLLVDTALQRFKRLAETGAV